MEIDRTRFDILSRPAVDLLGSQGTLFSDCPGVCSNRLGATRIAVALCFADFGSGSNDFGEFCRSRKAGRTAARDQTGMKQGARVKGRKAGRNRRMCRRDSYVMLKDCSSVQFSIGAVGDIAAWSPRTWTSIIFFLHLESWRPRIMEPEDWGSLHVVPCGGWDV